MYLDRFSALARHLLVTRLPYRLRDSVDRPLMNATYEAVLKNSYFVEKDTNFELVLICPIVLPDWDAKSVMGLRSG